MAVLFLSKNWTERLRLFHRLIRVRHRSIGCPMNVGHRTGNLAKQTHGEGPGNDIGETNPTAAAVGTPRHDFGRTNPPRAFASNVILAEQTTDRRTMAVTHYP